MVINVTQKVKRVRPKLTVTQKANRREKAVDLSNAINDAREAYQEEAAAISEKYKRSIKWTRQQLHNDRGLRKRRKPNAWNAFTSQKLNEANQALPMGQRWKLTAFIAKHGQELTTGYCRLSESAKENLRRKVHTLRKNRVKIVRSNPKTLQKQVNAMFQRMENEWENITSQTGVEGFYVAVRGDVEHFHESKIFYTPKAQSFIKEISHIDPKRFALKFESWVTGDFDTRANATQRLPPTKLISLCRTNIQEGLDAIVKKYNLSKKKIRMNYDNYEHKIVEMHGIALEGWTCGKVQNPGKIGRREDLVTLFDALVNDHCLWVRLTEEQVEQRTASNHERAKNGEAIYKPRKAMKKKVTSGAKSAAAIGDTDSSENEEVDEDEEEEEGTEGAVVVR